MQDLCKLKQVRQCRPLKRNTEELTQRRKVGQPTVKARHHRETRQPALGRFALQNERHLPAETEMKRAGTHRVSLPFAARIGSSSPSIKFRRSSRISAWRSMPGHSTRGRPKTVSVCEGSLAIISYM